MKHLKLRLFGNPRRTTSRYFAPKGSETTQENPSENNPQKRHSIICGGCGSGKPRWVPAPKTAEHQPAINEEETANLYKSFEKFLQNIYYDLHAIYEPETTTGLPNTWYSAAVDLFEPGQTYRVYFTLDEEGKPHIEHLERWYMG